MDPKLFFFVGVLIYGSFMIVEGKKLKDPQITCRGKTCVENIGKSGKFLVWKKSKNDKDKLMILFDAIKEVDANGNIVGKAGGKEGKHSFNNFAKLDFDFTEMKKVKYADCENATVHTFSFSALIPGPDAKVQVDMYFFEKNVSCEVCGKEAFPADPGSVKFNVKITDWTFCEPATCKKGKTGETGKFIDFTITIQKRGKFFKGKKEKKKARRLKFGDMDLDFPSYITNDGNCTEMPNSDTYPKIDTKGSKHSVTFRFPRFDKIALYDPVINTDNGESAYESAGSSNMASIVCVALFAIFTLMFF